MDEDTEIHSSEEGNLTIANRTRLQRATAIAVQIETDANDPPPTSQFTNDNPLTDLQGRQRAPLTHLRRCNENHTGNETPMNETLDEEVDFGSFESNANLSIHSDYAWSTPENNIVNNK